MNWTYRLTHWLWGGLDWLYPPVCGGCNRAGARWCLDCQKKIVPLPDPICEICGLPQRRSGVCFACKTSPPPYRALRSFAAFEGPARNVVHRLKYRRDLALGDALAQPLAEFARGLSWPVDLVIPVPLGKKRLQERGYNQVSMMAMPLAAINGWRYVPQALSRRRETRSQVGLSMIERQKNMCDAFEADHHLVAGQAALLIDDVTTTGSTLMACAEALSMAGASVIYAITFARALPHHSLKIV